MGHPQIVSQDEWLQARTLLLAREKALTQQKDAVNAERRRLPMVKIEKSYVFDGPDGKLALRALFGTCQQLIVYHFMFDPKWEDGCPGCTGYIDALGDLSMLEQRDTTFAAISRAHLSKLAAYKKKRGWTIPWYSSFGSDFNYDFHVTFDDSVTPSEYNYKSVPGRKGESHGLSVFFRLDDDVYHAYSSYARGVESLTDSYSLLDTTPYGRQEDFEESPAGWPQRPTYGS